MGIGGIIILSAVLGGLLVSLAFLIFTHVDTTELKKSASNFIFDEYHEIWDLNLNKREDYDKYVSNKGYYVKCEDANSITYQNSQGIDYIIVKKVQFEEEPIMKIYHTETQEDFDALMVELEKEGFLWASGKKPTYSLFKWNEFGKDTCIHLDNKFITRSDLAFVNQSYLSFAIEKYKANDTVNNPSHYNTGGIETLDYIKAKVPDYTSVAMSNIIKYVSRFPHKNGLEDLKKAQFYLNDLITFMEDDK